ncbi:MAG: glycosyltransferase [Lachnospiraceae bacterium]|nr:glycosyltransferase [Lachnospiraceae bacterium]
MSERIVDVVIPVYKPGRTFSRLINRLMKQTVVPNRIFIMQTVGSDSDRLMESLDEHIEIIPVLRSEFDHGGTRALGMDQSEAEYVLMMTQDAVPVDDKLIEHLLSCMEDELVGIAYARQLAGKNSGRVERMSRIYNYPSESRVKSEDDREELGIKTYFCSDVCALYRKSHYEQVGGFVQPTIFNEDMIIAYEMLQEGFKVAYCAEARVIHSHDYTCRQQFARNFDLGVSHNQYKEIFASISSEKEGAGYAKKVLQKLIEHGHFGEAFYFCLQCGCRLAGYRLGLIYDKLPKSVLMKCTGSQWYWE